MTNGEPQEVFSAPQAEPPPQSNELFAVATQHSVVEVDSFARAAAHLKMFEQLRKIAVKMTRPSDWHLFGDKPWPMRGAAEKVMRAMGLNLTINRENGVPYVKRREQDEKGPYFIVTVSGKIAGEWGDLEVMGFCSSRDDFFARDGKDEEGNPQYKPLSQIKEEHLIQAAYTNFVANAVMRYTGLSGVTKEDLESEYGVGTVSSHTYRDNKPKQTKEATAEDSQKAKRLWAILMIVTEGAEHEAKQKLKELSAFKLKDGKEVPGLNDVSKLSPGRLKTTLAIVEGKWKAWLEAQGDQRSFYEGLLEQRLQGGSDGDKPRTE